MHPTPRCRCVQISKGMAQMRCKGEYEVSLLLEPETAPPFEAVLGSLAPLVAARTPPDPENGGFSRDKLRGDLAELGVSAATLDAAALRWRWRLVNVAVSAGSLDGAPLTWQQLAMLRAELDFRMLHVRLAALARHCLHKLQDAGLVQREVVPEGVSKGGASGGTSKAGPAMSQQSAGLSLIHI